MTDAVIRYLPTARTLSIGDNALHFGHTLTRYLVRNNSLVSIFVAADATASPDSTEVESFDDLIVDGDVTVLHVYSTVELGLDDLGLGEVEVVGWAPLEPPGDLRQAGAHDPAGPYRPGDVVTDGGGLYTCTAPVVPDTRVDTFARPDQEGWGTASDGHVWRLVHGGSGDHKDVFAVAEHRGLVTLDPDGDGGDSLLLDPALETGDCDVLVAWKAPTTTTTLVVFVRSDHDAENVEGADLVVRLNGTQIVEVTGPESGDSHAGNWDGAAAGTVTWTRVRAVGQDYMWRTWVDGADEPGSWDGTYTASITLQTTSRYVGVSLRPDGEDPGEVRSFSATTLAPAPAADPEHWTALSDLRGMPRLFGPYSIDYTDVPLNNNSVTLFTPAVGDVLLRLVADPATKVAWNFGEVTLKTGTTALANTNDGIDDAHVVTPYIFTTDDPVVGLFTIGEGDTPSTGHVDVFGLVAHPVTP